MKIKARVLKEFKDKPENKLRKVGEVFEVTKERFEEIDTELRTKYKDVKWIEEVKEEVKETKRTTTRKNQKGSK